MARQPPASICVFAQNAMKQTRVPASSQLAQWIEESGWGAHSPGNNPFGMKPRKGMNDPYQNLMTTEYINKKPVKVSQPFRVFPSLQAAFIAHAQLISTAPVYAPAMRALPDLQKFVTLMGAKYATAPNYATALMALIKGQGLERYDS